MTTINEAVLRMVAWAQTFERDEEGQGLVEYGLILALIAVVCIGALTTVGTAVLGKLTEVAGGLA